MARPAKAAEAATDLSAIETVGGDSRSPDSADNNGGTDDALEAGIAAVFEEIRAGGGEGGDTDPDELALHESMTFALLSELNRLWDRQPA